MNSKSIADLQKSDSSFYLHPFTNHPDMHAQGTHLIVSGDGCWVVDENGRKLFDGLAGLWCVNVGYNRQEIVEAVYTQMKELAFYPSFFNTTTKPTIQLAEKLASLTPPHLKHSFFCNSGSEANESALKIIREYQHLKGRPQKNKIITRQFAYHGVTLGATSMSGLTAMHTPFDLPLPHFLHAPAPYPYQANSSLDPAAFGKWCLDETAKIIEKEGADTVAAIIAEPVQGAGGVIVPTVEYIQGLRKLARDHDILFVADEVITGFGRLGDWFASHLWNLDPDMITIAKGITSGYLPLGATIVSDEITEALNKAGSFNHGFTYSGHPSSAAAALANLDILEKENLIPRVRDEVGPYFQEKLQALASHPAVGNVRGYQLIGALELVPAAGKAALTQTSMIGLKASALVREEGAIVRGIRDSIAMAPPFIVTKEEINFLFDAIHRGLDRLWK